MTTANSYKNFGKLRFFANDCAALYKLFQTGQRSGDTVDRMRDEAISQSGLDLKDYGHRSLAEAVEYSVDKGLKVLTFHGNPCWNMDDAEFAAFLELLDKYQISEFVYESRDFDCYQTFYRLEQLGWKNAGLSRRPNCSGKRKERDGEELSLSDYVYGVKIKHSKKN